MNGKKSNNSFHCPTKTRIILPVVRRRRHV